MVDDRGSDGDIDPGTPAPWRVIVAKYREPSTPRAAWQLVNTLVPYFALWCLMYYTRDISWWLTMPLAILAGVFLVRVFIIFHDCGHGSFLRSRGGNEFVGFVTGLLTFSPYHHWRWLHAIHHGSAGHLDKRGIGDVWTLTVEEYLQSSRWQRLSYRLHRNPLVLFVLAPLFMFVIRQRFASPLANRRARDSVRWTNLALLGTALLLSWLFGIVSYLLIHATAMMVAGAAGVWLFYVQHQFEGVYWQRAANWNYVAAALQGSSFYKLPRALQWLSGNIGFHHIHHLSPHIPNYHLQACHEAEPLFQRVPPLTLRSGFRTLALRLWDEKSGTLVSYARMRQLRKERQECCS